MSSPSTIKTFDRVDLMSGPSLISRTRFRGEKIRVLLKAMNAKEVDMSAKRLADLFRSFDLRVKGPVVHKKYRGALTLRDPRSGSAEVGHHGVLIHCREVRVYEVTQEAINALIQFQCPLTVQIEVRKGTDNA